MSRTHFIVFQIILTVDKRAYEYVILSVFVEHVINNLN